MDSSRLSNLIFESDVPFLERARAVYEFQIDKNPVYRTFASHFLNDGLPVSVGHIPLLPIRAFKESRLLADGVTPDRTFKSSGTGDMERSRHFVADLDLYRRSILRGFNAYFTTQEFTLLCYAPGYSENPDSSLLWMLQYLVGLDTKSLSRFLPLEKPLTLQDVEQGIQNGRKILLFGAAFGLLDLIEMDSVPLPAGSHIIETGGMKTHRREMSKTELRKTLSNGFDVPMDNIHSEYGMCELMSQLYAIGGEWFRAPEWVYADVRDAQDPARSCAPGEEGKVAIIDLANLYSCPFILTEDKGVKNSSGEISILGRWNGAVLRGCNFLIDRD